ncbi:hypothetical protein Tco_0571664 [Tanacetum coccineum]
MEVLHLEVLWRIVKAKHNDTRPEDEFERVLWGDLKVMFEPDTTSDVWRIRNLKIQKMNIKFRGGLLGLKRLHRFLEVTAAQVAFGHYRDAFSVIYLLSLTQGFGDVPGLLYEHHQGQCRRSIRHEVQGDTLMVIFGCHMLKDLVALHFRENICYELKSLHKYNEQVFGINKWYQSFALRNFDLEDMELESTNSGPTAKLPILKLGEYEMWAIRIKQYFQIQDYALWEVIENGDSWVSVSQTSQENGITVTKMSTPATAEEKTNKKNDVKARGLLLMALPNEHHLYQ